MQAGVIERGRERRKRVPQEKRGERTMRTQKQMAGGGEKMSGRGKEFASLEKLFFLTKGLKKKNGKA